MEDPDLFLRKDYDAKKAMIEDLRVPITTDMVLQEINRYADSEFRYADKSDEVAIDNMVRDFGRQEEAKRRLLAFLATFIMFLIASGFFFILYLFQGASSSALGQFGFFENLFFFGRLGLSSAIIWAPIMVLSVMNRPRHWTKETW